jgi:uncharacterized protein (DUF58 family)
VEGEGSGWQLKGGSGARLSQWCGVGVVVTLVALVIRQPLIALLAFAVSLALAAALIWRRYGLRQIRYSRSFSDTRAFPDDEIVLEITLENAKVLPLPWLEVEDEFPDELEFPGLSLDLSTLPKVGIFRTIFSIRPYERVRRRYRVVCTRRGRHRFGPVRLSTGDIFGFASSSQEFEGNDYLVIYPRVRPVTEFGLPAKQPFGDDKPLRRLLEDPLQISGVRPYVPGDAPKRIHWRASARTGELQSKQYEPTATPVMAVFLDVNTFEHFWEGLNTDLLELAISAAASIVAHGLDERRQVGLYVNAPLHGGERSVRISPSRHPDQLRRVLEALALLIPHTGNRIEALIAAESRHIPRGATIVVVTGNVTKGLEETLARLFRAGHAITLLAFGDHVPDLPSRPGLAVYSFAKENVDDPHAAFQLA